MSGPIVPVTVVVAFYSTRGSTETRALTSAVGAVNARALIRMRRMPDVAAPDRAASPDDGVELRRMRREYVAPTEGDILGAEALIVGVPPRVGVRSPEWAPLVTMLNGLADQGKLRGKVAAVIPGGAAEEDDAFSTFLLDRGFVVVPVAAVATAPSSKPHEVVQAHGRHVAEVARALKSAGAR